jgi:hypothetical protein
MQNSMSEQRIISAVKIRPFQPQIGQQAGRTAVSQTQQFVERLKRQFGRFWLRLDKVPFHWLTTPAPLNQTILRQFMIDASQANYHQSRPSVMNVQQRLQPISNKQTFNAFMTNHLQQVVRTAVSSTHLNMKQLFWRQNQTRQTLTTRQYPVERQLLIQRLFQQGRRIEQPSHPQQYQPAASSAAPAAMPPFAELPMSMAHSPSQRTAQQSRPIPAQDEVIRVENGRFPAPTSAAQAAATLNIDELDGMQLQRLTDRIVRRIDDRIQAQRERLGRF